MTTSSCASVRFVASLLTTTQKLPSMWPRPLLRSIVLLPVATTLQRGLTFTRIWATSNTAFAYSWRPVGHSGDPGRAHPSSAEVAVRKPPPSSACSTSSYRTASGRGSPPRCVASLVSTVGPSSATSTNSTSSDLTREFIERHPFANGPGRSPVLRQRSSARARDVSASTPSSLRPRSLRAAPRKAAQPRQKRLAGLEDLEAGAAEGLMKFGHAQIPMFALSEELERHGRQEPAERPDRRAHPLGRPHLVERREAGRTLVRQEDRMPAGL